MPYLTSIDFNELKDTGQFRLIITVNQALPVKLVGFKVPLADKGLVDLFWRTLRKKDNDHFGVKRSKNGRTVTDVGAIAGARGSRAEQATFNRVIPIEVNNELTLYPNPAEAQLSLAGFAGGRVDIYDGLGRRLLGQNLPKDDAIDVAGLAPGRYLLQTDAEKAGGR